MNSAGHMPTSIKKYTFWLTIWLDIVSRWGFPGSSAGKESACNAEDPSSIPGLGRSTREGIGYPLQYSWASLWLSWQRIHLQCRRPEFNSWVGKIPWRRESIPTPVFWPREFHGLYNPWGHEESDMIEWLLFSLRYSSLYVYITV